jgi:immune inhibitor A
MRQRLLALPLLLALAACALPPIAQQPTVTPAATIEAVATATAPTPPDDATATAAPDAPTAAATTEPAADTPLDDPASLAAAQPGGRDQVALTEAFKGTGPVQRVVRTTPLDVKVGDVETFWVSNVLDNTNYQVQARLRYAGPNTLMYVDTSVEGDVDQADIERSARQFEQEIYPRDRELFGEELSPGIDGDARLTILNTPVQGAGGYFSSRDGVPKQINQYSNEREMFVIAINHYPLGTDSYGSTLAHEFQHMIEWTKAPRSPSWFNEGLSVLAEDLNGFTEDGSAYIALEQPDVQLTGWSSTASQTGEHYGTSRLFFRYIYEQYAGDSGLGELIAADAGNNPEAFVPLAQRKRPEIKRFADLYADWAVATALNDDSVEGGRYAYSLLPETIQPSQPEAGEVITSVAQFGSDYLALRGPLTLSFDGAERVAIAASDPADGSYMWWSNRGDDSVQTLTRAFDLAGVSKATLQFSTRYEIENDFDYAYVTVSADGGKSWTTLKGENTTDDDPQGANLGNGITGVSGEPGAEADSGVRGKWVDEQMDLTPFAGKQVLVRFWAVHDDALNYTGLLLDNIRIPELNYTDGAEAGDGGWEAQGFARTTGELPQEWTLRLIQQHGRDPITVAPIPTDADGRATVTIPDGGRAILLISGATRFTTEPAQYAYQVK